MNAPIPRELTEAWQFALEVWPDMQRHSALLGLAAKHEQFVWLASKYRTAAWSNPTDPIAPQQLARVQRATAIVALSKRTSVASPVPRLYRSAMVLLAGVVLATGVGLFITDRRVQQHQSAALRSR